MALRARKVSEASEKRPLDCNYLAIEANAESLIFNLSSMMYSRISLNCPIPKVRQT